jgi:hypothetical protein
VLPYRASQNYINSTNIASWNDTPNLLYTLLGCVFIEIKMNVKKIKEVVNLDISDEQKERYISAIIADDKKAIPTILNILNTEREKREELILDSNAELSRALIVLKDDNLKYSKKIIADPKWVAGEIIKHYQKWKDYIKCNFKVDGLS